MGMAQVVQQWLLHTVKANNPMIAQSMRLVISAVPIWHQRPEERGKQAKKAKFLSNVTFVLGHHQKVWF